MSTYSSPEIHKFLILNLISNPPDKAQTHTNCFYLLLPKSPILIQVFHRLLSSLSDSNDIDLCILSCQLPHGLKDTVDMLFHIAVPSNMVLDRVDPDRVAYASFSGQSIPTRHSQCTLPTTVPEQLAQIRNYNGRSITLFPVLSVMDEVESGARRDGFLAYDAVGEDA